MSVESSMELQQDAHPIADVYYAIGAQSNPCMHKFRHLLHIFFVKFRHLG